MPKQIQFDVRSLGLVHDARRGRNIGTAFALIRPDWYVTAKHVVVEHCEDREHLYVVLTEEQPMPARVLFKHPHVDLAVLVVAEPKCQYPLFPAHHAFASVEGLIAAGYAPSQRRETGHAAVHLTDVRDFSIEVRERAALNEETIVFEAPASEGGHSGGPIFGTAGGVVGVIIENFSANGMVMARGTNLTPLLQHLAFRGAA